MSNLLMKFYSVPNTYIGEGGKSSESVKDSELDHYNVFKKYLYKCIDNRLVVEASISKIKSKTGESEYLALKRKVMGMKDLKNWLYGKESKKLVEIQVRFVVDYCLAVGLPVRPEYMFSGEVGREGSGEENTFGNYVYNMLVDKRAVIGNKLLSICIGNIHKYLKLYMKQGAGVGSRGDIKVVADPKVLAAMGAGERSFIYICGKGTFDNSMMLFLLADRVLKVGGMIVLDNAHLMSVRDLQEYLDSNYIHYERAETTFKSFHIYKKLREDSRSLDFHIKFTCS